MLSFLWAFMIIAGVLWGGFWGADVMSRVANGALDSAKEAVELCVTMLGVVGMWNGVMNIARESGLIDKWTKKIEPAISFLFPGIPKNHPVRGDIATNIIANILGLGWAATPSGLKAMQGLAKINCREDINGTNKNAASDEMCTFLVLNISSLQLIPMNIIAYRSQYGSVMPTAIIGPGIVATMISTLVAIVFCRKMCKL